MIRDSLESEAVSDYFDRLCSEMEACQLGLRQWSYDIHNNPMKHIEKIKK